MDTFNFVDNSDEVLTNLDLLDEKRNQVRIREAKYKEVIAKYYNTRVKNTQFWVGDLILRNNETSRAKKTGKLEAKWEGPYQIADILSKGAYKLAYPSGESVSRTWHVSNLRRYYM